MAAGPKAAGFASFMRVFVFGLPFVVSSYSNTGANLHQAWQGALIVMAILTMTLGNVVAIVQNNVKRMLAYSSIAHAGYALVGVVAAGATSDPVQRNTAITAVMFYLLTYAVMNIGAFAVVQLIARSGDRRTVGRRLQRHRLRIAGAGVLVESVHAESAGHAAHGRLHGQDHGLWRCDRSAEYYGLVVIGVLNTAVSAYYYLRLIIVMFFGDRTTAWAAPRIPASIALAIVLTVLGVLYLGIFPGRVINGFQTRIESQFFTKEISGTK